MRRGPPRAGVGWVASGLAVVVGFLLIGTFGGAVAPAPSGPAGSSLATSPGGLAAYAELLARAGHPVQPLRVPLGQAWLPAGATVVVAEAPALPGAAARRLRQFVMAGGTLLLAGGQLAATERQVLADPPRWARVGTAGGQVARATRAARQSLGVGRVLTARPGGWPDPGPGSAELIVRPGGDALLLVRTVGRGRVELLGDASPLENQLLASADDAQLGLALAGLRGRPVVFAEALHGQTTAAGLAAIPGRWWATIAGLGLAGLLWAIGRGRRLGPVQRPAPSPPPARAEYVDAVATLLVRSRDRDRLAALNATASPPSQAGSGAGPDRSPESRPAAAGERVPR